MFYSILVDINNSWLFIFKKNKSLSGSSSETELQQNNKLQQNKLQRNKLQQKLLNRTFNQTARQKNWEILENGLCL